MKQVFTEIGLASELTIPTTLKVVDFFFFVQVSLHFYTFFLGNLIN